jgi:RNA polymerase sigma factor (sigma-70 family)
MRVYRRRVRTQLRTRGLSVPEIDDLAQEIFFGLHLSLKSSFPESVGALLYTITRRRVVDHLRTMGKEPYSLGLPSSASEPPKTPQDPGRALDGEAGRLWVLSQLTEEEKAILEAVDLDEMKVEDAAIALDIPLGTFKRHLGLARKKLAGLLQELQARGGEAA